MQDLREAQNLLIEGDTMKGKLIVMQGHAGSGKSTQTHKIAKQFGLKASSFSPVTQIILRAREALTGDSNYYAFYQVLVQLTVYRSLFVGNTPWATHEKGVVVDDGLLNVLPRLKPGATEKAKDDLREVIRFFRDGMRLRNGKEPDAVFYLEIDRDLATKRYLNRVLEGDVPHIEMSSRADEQIAAERAHWRFLSQEIPYLHIIDATPPEAEVTQSILNILERIL